MSNSNDNHITNPQHSNDGISFASVCEKRYSRRAFVKTSAAATLLMTACTEKSAVNVESVSQSDEEKQWQPTFDFTEIKHGIDETHHVAPDHSADILLRWGDPLFTATPEFDVDNQSAEKQSQQFGYNNDYIGYLELEPKKGQQARALLCVNHEYPIHDLMFPNFGEDSLQSITREQVAISQACVGVSIVEIVLEDRQWSVNKESQYNRRISALDSELEISGPVAGHLRLRTSADKTGTKVIGTLNNCAGGITPWGTYLSCEENFNYCFSGELDGQHQEAENHKRHNLPIDAVHWGKFDDRFNLGKEPNEPNRFGWVVEIDPRDPTSIPKKRTAMGRFKHEGAENVIAPDGRLVVYMGDDQRFEYLYKFVSRDKVDIENLDANRDLLDYGTLYVAKFFEEGHLMWLPLTYDNKVLKEHFESQADILIEPRKAADLLEATPMDRPEDVVPNAQTGKVYVMLTNNSKRKKKKVNAANPRSKNYFGHIIEINETDGDFATEKAHWDIMVKCGNPSDPGHQAQWNDKTSENGWFASPDNGVIDPDGRLWVSSDQSGKTHLTGTNDGLWAMETEGELRGTGRMFFRVPIGAEMCGLAFSSDGESLFLAVQHPGVVAKKDKIRMETAGTLWPDFKEGVPPRPAMLVVQNKQGGRVG